MSRYQQLLVCSFQGMHQVEEQDQGQANHLLDINKPVHFKYLL